MEESSELRLMRELRSRKTETLALLHDIGSLLEDCLPTGCVWLLKIGDKSQSPRTVYASRRYGTQSNPCSHIDPQCSQILELLATLERDAHILDIETHQSRDLIKSVFPISTRASLVVQRILPNTTHSWGYLISLIPAPEGTDVEVREQFAAAVLWTQFATMMVERRVLDERLQTTEARLNLATKAGGIGIFDWEISNDVIFWSPQQFDIYGVTPNSFKPSYSAWRSKVLPEDLKIIEEILRDTFRDHKRYFTTRHRFTHTSGQTRWIESLGEVIYNERNRPLRLIGTARDITKDLQAQEQIESDRRRLELALEAGELGFWDWDIPNNKVQFGGQWAHMLGYELHELEPHTQAWEDLVHPDDYGCVCEALQRHLKNETRYYESEHRLRHRNGSWIWVFDRGRVVERDATGEPTRIIGIQSDITSQRENREQLRQSDRRKDEFLATLAHELRNPLAPIRTGLAIIKRAPNSNAALRAQDIMERQLTHMVRLIDDLLDVSRITLGKLTLKLEDILLKNILEMAVESSQPALDAGGHTLTNSYPDEEVVINCDPTRLAQTISNLLTNAAKYTPHGGKISIESQVNTNGIKIAVSDNGLGIPQDLQSEIFEMFGQVNRTMERSQGGLGIGLALVQNLVRLHGGEISVFSDGIGKGSTFTISLPADLIRKPQAARKQPNTPPSKSLSRRVLIVDDNVDAAESLSTLARMLGHSTEVAYSGSDALKILNAFHPDVVFLDIGLPGMNGLDVAAQIKSANAPTAPYVVAVTGWGSEETKRSAYHAGFDEHLTKPVEPAKVEAILGR